MTYGRKIHFVVAVYQFIELSVTGSQTANVFRRPNVLLLHVHFNTRQILSIFPYTTNPQHKIIDQTINYLRRKNSTKIFHASFVQLICNVVFL